MLRLGRPLWCPPAQGNGRTLPACTISVALPSRSAPALTPTIRFVDSWQLIFQGVLVLFGAAIGFFASAVREYLTDRRRAERERDQRRWALEFDSLVELSNLIARFANPHGVPAEELETLKMRAAALAFRVRDDRPRSAVEPLLAEMVGSQQWRDQVGNAVRQIGETIQDLSGG